MKRFLSLICAVSLLFALASCGSQSSNTSETTAVETTAAVTVDYSNTELVGQITAIDGTSVTLTLGELTEAEQPSGEGPEGNRGEAPSGETPTESGSTDSTSAPGGETPPAKPDGESTDSSSSPSGETTTESGSADSSAAPSGETPPSKPDGDSTEQPSGEAPGGNDSGEFPSGMGSMSSFTAGEESVTLDLSSAELLSETMDGTESIDLDSLKVGDVLVLEIGDNNTVTSVTVKNVGGGMEQGGSNSGFGGSGEVTQGTTATELTEDGTYSDETYSSTGDDENALRVTGATVTLDGITVDKSDGATSNTEDGDFYGMNAALLATDGATVTITDATITSSAQNGNGVFSYGSGTTVNISDSTITTTADNSGGIQTTGGGTTIAKNLKVETAGNSSAAIRSDRGGGTVDVDGGTYTSSGLNSPAVYSTADITVKNATLTANGSEALVIEGQNSITLENCDVSGYMSDTKGSSSDINVHNVMIYQSMSGDAEEGTSAFSMTGGSLTSNNGDVFFVTNTSCTMYLSGVDIINKDDEGNLLTISGNDASHGWGTAGSNGAQVELTADNQTLEGDITVDTISTMDLTLTNGSVFAGTINILDNAEGGTAVDNNAVVTIEEGCTWTLTGDCTITSLTNNGTINFNGYTITLADGTILSE